MEPFSTTLQLCEIVIRTTVALKRKHGDARAFPQELERVLEKSHEIRHFFQANEEQHVHSSMAARRALRRLSEQFESLNHELSELEEELSRRSRFQAILRSDTYKSALHRISKRLDELIETAETWIALLDSTNKVVEIAQQLHDLLETKIQKDMNWQTAIMNICRVSQTLISEIRNFVVGQQRRHVPLLTLTPHAEGNVQNIRFPTVMTALTDGVPSFLRKLNHQKSLPWKKREDAARVLKEIYDQFHPGDKQHLLVDSKHHSISVKGEQSTSASPNSSGKESEDEQPWTLDISGTDPTRTLNLDGSQSLPPPMMANKAQTTASSRSSRHRKQQREAEGQARSARTRPGESMGQQRRSTETDAWSAPPVDEWNPPDGDRGESPPKRTTTRRTRQIRRAPNGTTGVAEVVDTIEEVEVRVSELGVEDRQQRADDRTRARTLLSEERMPSSQRSVGGARVHFAGLPGHANQDMMDLRDDGNSDGLAHPPHQQHRKHQLHQPPPPPPPSRTSSSSHYEAHDAADSRRQQHQQQHQQQPPLVPKPRADVRTSYGSGGGAYHTSSRQRAARIPRQADDRAHGHDADQHMYEVPRGTDYVTNDYAQGTNWRRGVQPAPHVDPPARALYPGHDRYGRYAEPGYANPVPASHWQQPAPVPAPARVDPLGRRVDMDHGAYGVYGQNEYGHAGYGQKAYGQGGFPQNGYVPNDYGHNTYMQNGHALNGHGANGYAENEHGQGSPYKTSLRSARRADAAQDAHEPRGSSSEDRSRIRGASSARQTRNTERGTAPSESDGGAEPRARDDREAEGDARSDRRRRKRRAARAERTERTERAAHRGDEGSLSHHSEHAEESGSDAERAERERARQASRERRKNSRKTRSPTPEEGEEEGFVHDGHAEDDCDSHRQCAKCNPDTPTERRPARSQRRSGKTRTRDR